MLTRRQLFMEVIRRSGKQTEKQAEKGHIRLLMVISVVVFLLFIFGGIPIAAEYHEHAGVVMVVILGILASFVFLYWMAFEGYYAIYCEECQRADQLAADQAISKMPKVEFTKEGMRHGSMSGGWLHHSIAVKNLSTASIQNPSVRLADIRHVKNPESKLDFNVPISLHNKNDQFGDDAKNPPIHPGDAPSVFDLIVFHPPSKQWKIAGVHSAEQIEIPPADYEVTITVQGDDLSPPAIQKFLIKNSDGIPALELDQPVLCS